MVSPTSIIQSVLILTPEFILALSTLALIIFRFFAPFDAPSPSFVAGGEGERGGRVFRAALAVLEADFSFLDGRLATLAERPIWNRP